MSDTTGGIAELPRKMHEAIPRRAHRALGTAAEVGSGRRSAVEGAPFALVEEGDEFGRCLVAAPTVREPVVDVGGPHFDARGALEAN